LLARYAGELLCARSAEEALYLARAHLTDLDAVLLALDVDVDGLALCRRLASLLLGVPILACGDGELLERAFDAGAQDFIARPFTAPELSARLRVALRLREERRKHALQEQRLLQWTRQLEKTKRDLESTICIDQLTGIANRRHFDNLLRAEWRRAARDHTALSLVIFDVDEFHAYNERYGHVGGDLCLTRVSDALAHALRRASDVLARYGGEELVAILPDTDETGACVVAERLRRKVEELAIPHAGSQTSRVVTLSGGVATMTPGIGLTPEMLVSAADAALFQAKREGRNRCRANGIAADAVRIQARPWPTCPVAVLDPILVQRVPKLLLAMKTDVSEALARATDSDFVRAEAVAHQARRMSTEYGFPQLNELAERIDGAVQRRVAWDIHGSLRDLAWYLEHIQVVYRRPVLRAV
jgi:diguanylate cyclase (GGDEF)-like protein